MGPGRVNSEGRPQTQVRETLKTTPPHHLGFLKKYALADLACKPQIFKRAVIG